MSAVLALDVGGSSVKSGWIDAQFRLRGVARETAIDSRAAAPAVIAALAAVVRAHWVAEPQVEPEGLAIGFPGPFEYERGVSRIRGLAKFEHLYGLNVGDLLRASLGGGDQPIRFGPDAEMGILGEANHGAGRPFRRLIGVGLGTGLGSAFVASSQVVRDGRGVPAGGHLYTQPWRGEPAEEVFSHRGLSRRLSAAAGQPMAPAAGADLARSGNVALQGAFREFGEELGQFLQPHVSAFGAEAVLCLGGIARAGELFFPALQQGAGVPVFGSVAPIPPALLGLADFFRGGRRPIP